MGAWTYFNHRENSVITIKKVMTQLLSMVDANRRAQCSQEYASDVEAIVATRNNRIDGATIAWGEAQTDAVFNYDGCLLVDCNPADPDSRNIETPATTLFEQERSKFLRSTAMKFVPPNLNTTANMPKSLSKKPNTRRQRKPANPVGQLPQLARPGTRGK
ncbi:MAG: hypothetical protein M2R45_03624 [Verrucomicrobia subdivision 3 bacterium]|nr:hypothetical protein [Limisphaerales bacterium]MCS1416881.1 hypothetical protein [Limisphaerales bacterium]